VNESDRLGAVPELQRVNGPDPSGLAPEESMKYLNDYHFPPYITLAHIFNAPHGWGFINRIMKQYCIHYVIGGRGTFAIGDKVYEVSKGDLFLYRPFEAHSISTIRHEDFILLTVTFHFEGSRFPFDDLFQYENYLGNYLNHQVERYISELTAKYQQPGLHRQIGCQGLLLQILSESSRFGNERNPAGKSAQKNLAKLVQIQNYMMENLNQSIVPERMEHQFGLSWNYVIAQFTKTFGISPGQYLLWERVRKAKELALKTDLSFGEIANRVGYANVHALGKMFKKKTGMSLTDYCTSICRNVHNVSREKM